MPLKVSRILHAGYVFENAKTQIAFDPIFENPFSRNCHAFPEVHFDMEPIKALRLAAVFISHYHDDHCSLESLNLLHRDTPIYIYCVFPELFDMIRALGFKGVHPLSLNETLQIGPFKVTTLPALDLEVDSIFQITVGPLNLLNVVDSWIGPRTLDVLSQTASWDLVLWPFQTLREIEVLSPARAEPAPHGIPHEWREQLQILKPKCLIASSCQFIHEPWSWYNKALFPISYRGFADEVQAIVPATKVIRLDPSESFLLTPEGLHPAPCLPWVKPAPKVTTVDYEYDPSLKAPSTKDIALNFSPLTKIQSDFVHEYCRRGILSRYQDLAPLESGYFSGGRVWRLSVYDHLGGVIHYIYRVYDDRLESAPLDREAPSWTTEVSSTKLYLALTEGESLTSLYLRVNDVRFSPEIEAQIANVDILEDPLIRCLFTGGQFGAYQLAQLKRLTKISI